jgi:putative salt-induced outer membrane protein YdiY
MKKITIALAPVLAGSLFSSGAIASEAAGNAEENKLWSGEIDASYLNLSGNTEEATISGAVHLVRVRDQWEYIIHADGLSSKKDEDRTAEKYYAYNKLSYNFSEKSYYFGLVSYTDDHFSGYDYQAAASAGLGRNLLSAEDMTWDVEAGIGFRESKLDDNAVGDDESEAIARLATTYTWKVSDSADFRQYLATEMGEENTLSYSETALKVKVNGSLSIKLSYKVKYTEEVPIDTKHSDTETLVSRAYSF